MTTIRKLPCVNDLWHLVSGMMHLVDAGVVTRQQLRWLVHPAMWSQMLQWPTFRDGGPGGTPIVEVDFMAKGGGVGWRMFGFPVKLDVHVNHPILTIAMECMQEYQTP